MKTKRKTRRFPPGWDEKRAKSVVAYFDKLTDDEWVAEDEAAFSAAGHTTTVVPNDLVPKVRALIARRQKEA